MTRPKDFKINFPRLLIGNLKDRIAATQWPSAPSPDDWSLGTPANALREILVDSQHSEMPYGGHFTVMVAPVPFSYALIEFINKLRDIHT